MDEHYYIEHVKPEWAVEPEAMGTKSKFWYRHPEQGESEWLFKYPRKNTGEHWAEKIASEIAEVLGIPHARVELAELEEGPDGSPSARGTASKAFLVDRRDLIHGNEIMAHVLSGYDPGLRSRQTLHTFTNIMDGLHVLFGDTSQGRKVSRILCEYLVLDAVVGNTDRHHENWAVRPIRGQRSANLDIAPTFDHASSLGRELLDERRERFLKEGRVGIYSEKGSGAIYWSESDRDGPSPLNLVRWAAPEHPNLFVPVLRRLNAFVCHDLCAIVSRVPQAWMSSASRRFAVKLLCYNCKQLKELLEKIAL